MEEGWKFLKMEETWILVENGCLRWWSETCDLAWRKIEICMSEKRMKRRVQRWWSR